MVMYCIRIVTEFLRSSQIQDFNVQSHLSNTYNIGVTGINIVKTFSTSAPKVFHSVQSCKNPGNIPANDHSFH
jgi:hypothetical protein